jgi:hypothetical protein
VKLLLIFTVLYGPAVGADGLPATYVEGFHDLEAVKKMPYRYVPPPPHTQYGVGSKRVGLRVG